VSDFFTQLTQKRVELRKCLDQDVAGTVSVTIKHAGASRARKRFATTQVVVQMSTIPTGFAGVFFAANENRTIGVLASLR